MELTVTGKKSDLIMERLKSWSLTDSSGFESDACKLVIDSHDMEGLPDEGEKYSISLGGVNRGDFVISRRTLTLNPVTITVMLVPEPFNIKDKTGYRDKKSQSWENTTLGQIIKDTIKPHGFEIYVHNSVENTSIEHIARTNETVNAFMYRLAKQFDCWKKIVDGNRFVFSPKGKIKNAIGEDLERLVIDSPHLLSSFSADLDGPDNYNGVRAFYRAFITPSKKLSIELGKKPFKNLRDIKKTESEAKRAASVELKRLNREGIEINLTMPIDSRVAAESVLILGDQFPSVVEGDYSIDRVVFNDQQQMSIVASSPQS